MIEVIDLARREYTGVEALGIQILKTSYRVAIYRKNRRGILADTVVSVKKVKLKGSMKIETGVLPGDYPSIYIEFPRARKVKIDEFDVLRVGY